MDYVKSADGKVFGLKENLQQFVSVIHVHFEFKFKIYM